MKSTRLRFGRNFLFGARRRTHRLVVRAACDSAATMLVFLILCVAVPLARAQTCAVTGCTNYTGQSIPGFPVLFVVASTSPTCGNNNRLSSMTGLITPQQSSGELMCGNSLVPTTAYGCVNYQPVTTNDIGTQCTCVDQCFCTYRTKHAEYGEDVEVGLNCGANQAPVPSCPSTKCADFSGHSLPGYPELAVVATTSQNCSINSDISAQTVIISTSGGGLLCVDMITSSETLGCTQYTAIGANAAGNGCICTLSCMCIYEAIDGANGAPVIFVGAPCSLTLPPTPAPPTPATTSTTPKPTPAPTTSTAPTTPKPTPASTAPPTPATTSTAPTTRSTAAPTPETTNTAPTTSAPPTPAPTPSCHKLCGLNADNVCQPIDVTFAGAVCQARRCISPYADHDVNCASAQCLDAASGTPCTRCDCACTNERFAPRPRARHRRRRSHGRGRGSSESEDRKRHAPHHSSSSSSSSESERSESYSDESDVFYDYDSDYDYDESRARRAAKPRPKPTTSITTPKASHRAARRAKAVVRARVRARVRALAPALARAAASSRS